MTDEPRPTAEDVALSLARGCCAPPATIAATMCEYHRGVFDGITYALDCLDAAMGVAIDVEPNGQYL